VGAGAQGEDDRKRVVGGGEMIRWLLNLFNRPDVMLIDHDGEITFSRSYYIGNRRFADRLSHPVQLLDGGTTQGRSYVRSWEEL
jgi:hypothetical protein